MHIFVHKLHLLRIYINDYRFNKDLAKDGGQGMSEVVGMAELGDRIINAGFSKINTPQFANMNWGV